MSSGASNEATSPRSAAGAVGGAATSGGGGVALQAHGQVLGGTAVVHSGGAAATVENVADHLALAHVHGTSSASSSGGSAASSSSSGGGSGKVTIATPNTGARQHQDEQPRDRDRRPPRTFLNSRSVFLDEWSNSAELKQLSADLNVLVPGLDIRAALRSAEVQGSEQSVASIGTLLMTLLTYERIADLVHDAIDCMKAGARVQSAEHGAVFEAKMQETRDRVALLLQQLPETRARQEREREAIAQQTQMAAQHAMKSAAGGTASQGGPVALATTAGGAGTGGGGGIISLTSRSAPTASSTTGGPTSALAGAAAAQVVLKSPSTSSSASGGELLRPCAAGCAEALEHKGQSRSSWLAGIASSTNAGIAVCLSFLAHNSEKTRMAGGRFGVCIIQWLASVQSPLMSAMTTTEKELITAWRTFYGGKKVPSTRVTALLTTKLCRTKDKHNKLLLGVTTESADGELAFLPGFSAREILLSQLNGTVGCIFAHPQVPASLRPDARTLAAEEKNTKMYLAELRSELKLPAGTVVTDSMLRDLEDLPAIGKVLNLSETKEDKDAVKKEKDAAEVTSDSAAGDAEEPLAQHKKSSAKDKKVKKESGSNQGGGGRKRKAPATAVKANPSSSKRATSTSASTEKTGSQRGGAQGGARSGGKGGKGIGGGRTTRSRSRSGSELEELSSSPEAKTEEEMLAVKAALRAVRIRGKGQEDEEAE